MDYKVATYFSSENWESQGLNWLRTAKSLSLTGYIIGYNLSEEATSKISQLGFICLPLKEDENNRVKIFQKFISQLKPQERCMWLTPSLLPKANFETESDLVCELTKSDIFNLTEPVTNLYDRAAMIESLREKIEKKYSGYFSTRYVLATSEFWHGFLGCLQYMQEKSYFDANTSTEELILNFFTAFANRFTVEVKDYDSVI